MSTKLKSQARYIRWNRQQFFSRCVIALFMLLAVFMLVQGARGWRVDSSRESAASQTADKGGALVPELLRPAEESIGGLGAVANELSTPTQDPGNRASSPFPDNVSQQSSQTSSLEASAGTLVNINFDNVPNGTLISNQYAPAIFSTDWPLYTFANSQHYYGSSAPNCLDRGPTGNAGSGFAPFYVDFTSPVNNLRFYLLAADDLRSGIAQLRIFRYGTLVSTRPLDGRGVFYVPILIDIGGAVSSGGMGYDNVTRIEIVNITDTQGLAVDDFSFTVPAPTPTPTPTPLPTPFPPTNLIADVDKTKVSLVWDFSAGAVSYNVKRRSTISEWTRIATGLPTTRFEDSSAIPDTSYFYAVTAVNAHGESADSSTVSAMLVPSCGDYVEARPPAQQYPDRGNGWAMNAEVSDRDGLVLTDVSLKGRYMAKMMSLPYFYLKTSKMSIRQRGELTPNSNSPTMRTRLVSYSTPVWTSSQDGHVVDFHIRAQYAVDRITPTSKSCLLVTQDYEFDEKRPGDLCEPTGLLPCARFYPRVSYSFEGRDGETLESINVAQRLHYRVNGKTEGTTGVFRDCDVPFVNCGSPAGAVFKKALNPVIVESFFPVVKNGQDLGSWDNIHQTWKETVEHPLEGILHGHAGCPECVHTHWRWGTIFGHQFGSGRPIIGNSLFNQTNQDVDIGILRYKPGEEHPNTDFKSFISSTESVRNVITRVVGVRPFGRRIEILRPTDVLYWYSATSHEPSSDLFFKHGSFFNPDDQQQMTAFKWSANASSSAVASHDGVRLITYGHVYKDGSTTFSTVDPSTLASLPAGYVTLDNVVHRIATDAIVSGPHTVSFDVPSVSDQAAFNDLAIFHLEPDRFDPDNLVWVDVTVLSPDTPAPDFANRIISARVNDVGLFAIGKLVQTQPDPGSSDLSVTVSYSPDPVVVENNLTYTLHITNSGPQTATGVGLIDVLPQETAFVSAFPTQGNCKYKNGSVYCKLGTLVNGGVADVTIVASPREDRAGWPSQGSSIANTVVVAGDNDDPNLDNNVATGSTLVLRNPNSRPSVAITTPLTGATYVGPANLAIMATATDSDGTISRVEFYDGGTLIGTGAPTGAANQYQLSLTPNFGPHTFLAIAIDNGGRANSSDPVNFFVNGAASVNITAPSAGAVFDPLANLTVTANATNPSGPISKIEFFANSTLLGEGSLTSANQYSVTWNSVPAGAYTLSARLTDSSGVITNSSPVNITITNKPTVTILSPADGMSYPSLSRVAMMAATQDGDGFVTKVDFYANGSLIGAGSYIGQDRFTIDWMQVPTGVYSLTAIATDNLGVRTTSAPVSIGVNTAGAQPGEFIWFDDVLPTGATAHGDTDVDWYWVDANPGAFSGTKSHQSRNFAQLNAPNSIHQHSFDGATQTLPLNAGDKLFTYVFLDINNMPREIMLQWKDANGSGHRAYWGANNINLGIDGKINRRYMGPLPKAGQWVRLEVPASAVGLEGSTLDGMAFILDGGRATWDLAGKTTANAPPPPTTQPGDSVWIDDALPAGAIPSGVNDNWSWVPAPVYSGQVAHRSFFGSHSNAEPKYRSHSFTGAQTPITVNPGDVLFTYVYLGDPDLNHQPFTPNEIMLQWYDGTSWEHRAYWGENYIGQQVANIGVQGTESQRDMGGLPAARGWYRLEVPASYVGLEGKSVSGMAFSAFRNENNPFITWDRSGKSPQLTTMPLPLSATTGVWKAKNPTYGYSFETNDQGLPGHLPQKSDWFFAHPNQAAGTVPFHRLRSATNTNEYFYSQYRELYDGHGWIWSGIAYYVYPNGSTAGTGPLYLFHDNQTHYYMTTDESVVGMTRDGSVPWAYVLPVDPRIPAAPSSLTLGSCALYWRDNSITETGFQIQEYASNTGKWETVAIRGANSTSYCFSGDCDFTGLCATTPDYKARVLAYNGFGVSPPSNVVQHGVPESLKSQDESNLVVDPPTSPPQVNITRPAEGEVVDHNFAIFANAFDADGNGTIVKVEFFADGNKLGEVYNHPYVFFWDNATSGAHSLTAKVSDNAGASTTSSPVNVIVGSSNAPPTISVTAPTNGDTFNAPATMTISATAFDTDGSISKVEFFQGPTKLGEDATAPYSFNWTNVGAGSYSLTATATDNLGATSTSAAVNITVDGSNVSPTVSITAPTSGAVFTAPASFSINASASDTDGSVSKVEFFQWGTKIGEVTTAPFSFSWTNVPAGNYALTAMATDDRGASSTSNTVSVTVNQPAPPSDYRAYTDFSNVQGYRNWYYLESTGAQMSFDAANNRWQGSETSSLLFNYGGQPGQSVDAVRQWRAPQAGTVRITGNAADTNGICGDGVVVSIKKGAQGLWQQTIENGDSTGFNFDLTTTVAVGDQINFIINKRSLNNGCDSTRFDSSITYTSVSNQSPIANAGGPYSGTAGIAVQFNGSNSYDPDGTIASYSWTFGDGGSGAGITPSHIYSAAGTYNATLTVTDNSGAQSSANATVTIGNSNQPPVANAAGPYSGIVGTPVQFNGGGSFDPDGVIVSYAWTFGDGGTGSGATPVHTYTAVGTYIASLTVTDNGGGQSSANVTITISSDGSNTVYGYRRSVTIDHTRVSNTDQANFPVLISGLYSYLATVANGGKVQNANGYDVVFTSDSGCANKLDHEVETYNASGMVNYWVKVPLVSHTSDSMFYLCYGNPSITTDRSNRTAVWDNNYKGVWHLPNGTNLTTTDSTANANHGSSNNATATAGEVDGAASYNGSGQSTIISNPANFDYEHSQPFSVEFWLKKPLDTATNQTLISKKYTYWNGAGFQVWTWSGSNNAIFDLTDSAGGVYQIATVVNVQDNSWHHIGVTYDGTSNRSGMKIYVDGSLMSTGPSAAIANSIRNTYNLTFGTNSISPTDYFNGSLDEIRFSNSARTADWIKTQYNNQSSPSTLYTISLSDSVGSNQLPVANAGGSYSGIVGTSVQFNGSGSSDPDGMIVSYAWTFGDGGTGSGATPLHTYTAGGTYTATLTVADNGGAQSSANAAVMVGNLPGPTQIVFASNRDGTSQLYHMNTDGSLQVRLTNNFANDESPRWSPNNTRIVFQSDRANPFSGVADIYLMNADGSGQTRLTSDAADDSAPVWSPDGTKIAFQSARNGVNYQVYVMNADGSGQVNISNNAANDGQPLWSPDGTRIAFASDRDHPGIASIYVMNANGSNQTRLTFSGSEAKDEQPTWSPDGARIAFVSTRDSIVVTWQETDDEGLVLVKTKVLTNKEVYRMNADGTGQVRLTNTLESDDSPVWSRDGLKLLFRSDRERECCDPGAQIWVMNADGSNQLNLSNNGFGDYGPNW
jgi:uncharacterized repeat protein (TIGR01451 family)